ncbi:MAG: immunity 22 family protein [Azonexus sp.]|jgi:hypothetical protein|nr:immunity 22 family protein [Azonexus sp.]
MAKTHHDMRVGKRISIWLGNIADEEELDSYLDEHFASDFGFEIYAPDGPECSAQEEADVRSLLEGFSQWRQFIDAAVNQANAVGLARASCAIVFYNFEYDPSLIKNAHAPVHFIGAIPYSAS